MTIGHGKDSASSDVLRCVVVVEAVLLDIKDLVFFVPGGSGKSLSESTGRMGGAESALIGRVSVLDNHARSRNIKVGDRVALCQRSGNADIPDELVGAAIATTGTQLHPLPTQWPLNRAVATASLAFASRALRAGRFTSGDICAVVGLSPAGLLAIKLLHELGAVTVLGVDADPARRDVALAFGATDVMSPDVFATPASLNTVSAFDKVFFMSTGVDLLAASIRAVSHLGIVVVAGSIAERDFVISDYYREIIIKESSIIGVDRPARDDWAYAVARLEHSEMWMQELLATISVAYQRDGRLKELAASGIVFGPICVVDEC